MAVLIMSWGKERVITKSADTPQGKGDAQQQAPSHSQELISTSVPVIDDSHPKSKVNKRIGEWLVEQGAITIDQLSVALYEKQKRGKLLGETLVELGFIKPEKLTEFLAETTGLTFFDPKKAVIDPEVLTVIQQKDALKLQVLPVAMDRTNNTITFAMADPYDIIAIDKLKQLVPRGFTIESMIAPPMAIVEAIHRNYSAATSIEGILQELQGDKSAMKKNVELLSEDEAYSHPLVRLVNALVFEALKMGASDLHFEPEENFIRFRYRVDGDLVTVHTLHKEYWSGICQRIKIMAQMNIADKLTPQDGRFNLNIGGREADFRVSVLPTVHGENIVMRVLDQSASIKPLEALGFSEHNMNLIKKCLLRPEGIVIVTGPTGSGKSTTLYSMVNAVNTPDVNIQTLEDPVEYTLGLIRQTNVRADGGFTFGEGVKALLRQDPDIIFIGEVRDEVTAEQALKAAMTGHQVFTSLHTNDSFGAIPRLVDLGLKPSMMAGAIIASFAQRLVRMLCQKCKKEAVATAEECKMLGVDPTNPPKIYHPGGCPACANSGYKGRIACVEILYFDEELDDLMASGAGRTQLKEAARRKGFKNMVDDGVLKILQGVTSLDAVSKSLNFTDRM